MSIVTDYIDEYVRGEVSLVQLGMNLKNFPWATPSRLAFQHHKSALEALHHADDTAFDEDLNTWDEVRTARFRDRKLTPPEYLYLVRQVRPE